MAKKSKKRRSKDSKTKVVPIESKEKNEESANDDGWSPTRVKALRSRLGLTQEGFARMIGVTWITVNRWERGKSLPQNLSRKELERIAEKAA